MPPTFFIPLNSEENREKVSLLWRYCNDHPEVKCKSVVVKKFNNTSQILQPAIFNEAIPFESVDECKGYDEWMNCMSIDEREDIKNGIGFDESVRHDLGKIFPANETKMNVIRDAYEMTIESENPFEIP